MTKHDNVSQEGIMKATEFFKSMGMDAVKGFIKNGNIRSPETELELKRLVASHELVERDFESVEIAEYEYMISASHDEPYWIRVKQAIADVEACQ